MTASKDFEILPEQPGDAAAINAVLDDAFGPGRFAKSSYRLREGVEPLPELGFVAKVGGEVIGSIRYWPVTVHYEAKADVPALLLGPLAVVPTRKHNGVGMGLMKASLEAAKAAGHKTVILVGDEPYYARMGFSALACMGLKMPGPFDPSRLLGLDLDGPVLDGTPGAIQKPL